MQTDNSAPVPERRGAVPAWWSFRVGTGITARVMFPLLARHRLRISPSRIPAVLGGSLISLVTLLPAFGQRRRFGRTVAETKLPPPVFIVGHWRSGTTFLHELLATDRRFLTPTYLHTFATDYCLVWGGVLRRLEAFLPSQRPMDDIAAGWDRPQEDEFGLLATGARSPYEVMLFPNDRTETIPHLDVEAMAPADQQRWREALVKVMKRVVVADREADVAPDPELRLLLKSPTHTARIGTLQRMFPDARFIHVTRHPFALYTSSEHLWRRMFETQGLQRPRYEGPLALDRFVNETMKALYRNFDDDVAALPEGSFVETRYDDIVGDPAGELARIRSALGLPAGDAEALQRHLEEVSGHRRNRFVIDAETAEMIRREWRWYFDRFGYDADAAP